MSRSAAALLFVFLWRRANARKKVAVFHNITTPNQIITSLSTDFHK